MAKVDIFSTDKKYVVILADPPWKQSKGGKKSVRPNTSGKELDYRTCELSEIAQHLRQATSLTTDNAVLFLWTIDKYLIETQKMAEMLGWKLHARMVWNKVTGIPAAFTIRYGHEYLLYMYRGKLLPVATEERGKLHSVFTEKAQKHSQKPDVAYQIIERLYPFFNRLELYARRARKGWDIWGDEAPDEEEL